MTHDETPSPSALPLPSHQQDVVRRVLDEESQRRSHLVVALGGAHAYGFPSADSDLDLKGLHVEPTSRLLGLRAIALHAERMETIDSVDVDYSSNEIQPALVGILQGNGNFAERVLGRLIALTSPEHEELRALVHGALSRRLYRHYHGFAESQVRALEAGPTAKRLLYVLRTALTGAHVLLTGDLVTDLGELIDEHGFGAARALVDAKREAERLPLQSHTAQRWAGELRRAFDTLDDAHARSVLPAEPARDALESWLVELRRRRW